MRSFGHKTHSFCHNPNWGSNQKTSLTKVVQLYSSIKESLSEDYKLLSFGHKTYSFCHNPNWGSNQKPSLTKVVQLNSAIKENLSED